MTASPMSPAQAQAPRPKSRVSHAKYLRRKAVDAFMGGLCFIAALLGLLALGLILTNLLIRGIGGVSVELFTQPMKTPGQHGGLANAMVGSLMQVAMGAAMGAPLGVAIGVYLAEVGRTSRLASTIRFANDILLSAPSVLIGLFVYQIVVRPSGSFSALAGSIALALIAMPVVARTTEDMIKLVPDGYRDGSIALGARLSTTISKVVVPAAFSGILTGILLALARIAGETAPLIVTSFGNQNWNLDITRPTASLPIAIYRYAQGAYPEYVRLAWGGALTITLGVLLLNILSRIVHHSMTAGRK